MTNGVGLVSVIIPVCNQGDHARRTVRSVRDGIGDLPHEIILVDDQSTDGSCHGMPKDVLILRTLWRAGVSLARRLGFSHSRGDVIIWSDPHCFYPPGSLCQLAESASRQRAILQPKTVSRLGTRERLGGRLTESERGLRVAPSRREPAKYPALMGTIYALRRDVYTQLGGWPRLPGVWGCSEQALTLMSWFLGIPILVDSRFTCVHREYQRNRQFPFSVSQIDWAGNAHYVHAAFFPERYHGYWRPILENYFGRDSEYTKPLRSGAFRRLLEWIQGNAVRTEEEFFRHVLDRAPPSRLTGPTKVESHTSGCRSPASIRSGIKLPFEWLAHWLAPADLSGGRGLFLCSQSGRESEGLVDLDTAHWKGMEFVLRISLSASVPHQSQRNEESVTLPVSDSSWDVVACCHALEHWPHPARAIGELSRLLRPNGWLCLAVPGKTGAAEDSRYDESIAIRKELRRVVRTEGVFEASTLREAVVRVGKGKREFRLVIQKKDTDQGKHEADDRA